MQVTVTWAGNGVEAQRGSARLELPSVTSPAADDPLCAADLLLTALGACAVETLRSHPSVAAMPIRSLRVTVESELVGHPSRYDNFRMQIDVDGDLTDRQRETVLRIARACRVGNTLQRGARVSVSLAAPASTR